MLERINLMERQYLSTDMTIQSIGYEITKQILEVEFCTGDVFAYDGVTYPIYRALMTARSRNKYFERHIMNNYPNRRIAAISADSLVAF
jgi:hypothetical protein